jgi:flagellar basal body rod protein FlgG
MKKPRAEKPLPKNRPSKRVGSGTLVRRLEPNEITGIVVQTNVDYDRFGQRRQHMAVQWPDGTRSSEIPMIVIAKSGDAFVFTLRPA